MQYLGGDHERHIRAELIGFSFDILHGDVQAAEVFNRDASLAYREQAFYHRIPDEEERRRGFSLGSFLQSDSFTRHADGISLVILDVVMPKTNGKQACEAIRSLRLELKVRLYRRNRYRQGGSPGRRRLH